MKASSKITLIGVLAAFILAPVVGLTAGLIGAMLFLNWAGTTSAGKSGELLVVSGLGVGGLVAISVAILTFVVVLVVFRRMALRITSNPEVGEDAPVGGILLKAGGLILLAFVLLKAADVAQELWARRPQELNNQQVIEALGDGSKTWGQEKNLTKADVPAILTTLADMRAKDALGSREKLIQLLLDFDDPQADAELELWIPILDHRDLRIAVTTRLLSRGGKPAPRHEVLFKILRDCQRSYSWLEGDRQELATLAAKKPAWSKGLKPEDHSQPKDRDLFLALYASYEEDPVGVLWEHLKQLPETDGPDGPLASSYGYALLKASYQRSPQDLVVTLETYLSVDVSVRHQVASQFVSALKEPSPGLQADLLRFLAHWLRLIAETEGKVTYPGSAPGGAYEVTGALRICDQAAQTLARWDPKTYVFEANTPPEARSAQISKIQSLVELALKSSGD